MIRVVDIETTGMDPAAGAEVIEVGFADIDHDTVWPRTSYLYSSERPCPPEVLAVHHILDEEREDRPRYSRHQLRSDLHMSGYAPDAETYAAHNASFERSYLSNLSDRWVCTYKAALRIWPDAPSHGNQALMYWLGLHRSIPLRHRMPPHRALPDAVVTAHILLALLAHTTTEEMIAWTEEPRLLPRCPIGKFRGRPWPEVDRGFLDWTLRQSDMDPDIQWNVRRELTRRARGD